MRLISNIDAVIRQTEDYRRDLESRKRILMEKLAQLGIDTATLLFQTVSYDGQKDAQVSDMPEWVEDNRLRITARGKTVLFLEFGSGAMFGYGHPKAAEMGYGPGTFSDNEALGGKHHWNDPKGWYYEHGHKSHGNEPAMAMQTAAEDMRRAVAETAREVFSVD